MSRSHYGQNIMETAIMIAVIAIAVILAVTVLGKEINTTFSLSHTAFAGYQPFGPGDNTNLNIKAGSFGGTSSNPISKCSAGTCSIDYGDFALNGVSENFGELIETTGASAGTNQLANILQDIADQLKENGDTEGYNQYTKMANLAHFMADIEEANDEAIKGCAGIVDVKSCAHTNLKTELGSVKLPETLKDVLTRYGSGTPLLFQNIIGNAKYIQNIAPSQFNDQKKQHAAYAIVDVYDSIMANDSYPPGLKDVTTKLYKNINDLAAFSSYSNIHINDFGFSRSGSYGKYDPVTGNRIGNVTINNTSTTDLTNPEYFKSTDLNSALVCVSSSNHDNGSECK